MRCVRITQGAWMRERFISRLINPQRKRSMGGTEGNLFHLNICVSKMCVSKSAFACEIHHQDHLPRLMNFTPISWSLINLWCPGGNCTPEFFIRNSPDHFMMFSSSLWIRFPSQFPNNFIFRFVFFFFN